MGEVTSDEHLSAWSSGSSDKVECAPADNVHRLFAAQLAPRLGNDGHNPNSITGRGVSYPISRRRAAPTGPADWLVWVKQRRYWAWEGDLCRVRGGIGPGA